MSSKNGLWIEKNYFALLTIDMKWNEIVVTKLAVKRLKHIITYFNAEFILLHKKLIGRTNRYEIVNFLFVT